METTCQDWQLAFWQALDAELPPENERELAAHIRSCNACRDAFEEAVAAHRALMEAGVAGGTIFIETPEKKTTHEIRTEPVAPRLILLDRRWILFAATVLLVVGIAAYRHFFRSSANLSTLATVAKLTDKKGDVYVLSQFTEIKNPAEADQGLSGMSGLEIEPGGEAAFEYRDGTHLKLAAGQTPASLWVRYVRKAKTEERTSFGKRIKLENGTLEANVAPQSAADPMILGTAQAEATVLGTRFTLSASMNQTRLDVQEGHVRFTRLTDGQSVVIGPGEYAVAGDSSELHVKKIGDSAELHRSGNCVIH